MSFIIEYDPNSTTITKLSTEETIMNFTDSDARIIGYNACSNGIVEEIDLSETHIIQIATSAFGSCKSLKKITFPETLEIIEKNAFLGTALTNIHIPSNVSNMTGQAWNQIPNLASFSVDENNQYFCAIYGSLFSKDRKILYRTTCNISYCSDIPYFNEITTIGGFALTSIPITAFYGTENLTTLEEYSFHAMDSLKTIDLTYSPVKVFPTYTFRGLSGLQIIKCPITLEEIDQEAFYGNSVLKTIVFQFNLKIIQDNTTYSCSNIRNIFYYGYNDFSNVKFFSSDSDKKNTRVFITIYRYELFAQMPVQTYSCHFTCNNRNHRPIYSIFCLIFLQYQ